MFGMTVKIVSILIAAVCSAAGCAQGEAPERTECGSCGDARHIAEICDAKSETARITVVVDGKKYVYDDEKITPSDFTVADEIETRRINAPLENKIELVDTYLANGADFKTALEVAFPLLVRRVNEICAAAYEPPIDAQVVYRDGKFSVANGKDGRRIDENRLYGSIYYALKYGVNETVSAAFVKIKPNIDGAELRSNLVLRGRYVTDFTTSSAARAHNVALALKKLDGKKICAGETLSFNAAVGERTEANGFKKAKVISYGKYVDGVGGGVCQASTAVYNAAIVSGLDCAANAHSICPSYCPPGLDAMISGVSDLKITNNTGKDVYISCLVKDKRAFVAVYGAPSKYTIEPQSVVTGRTEFEQTEFVDTEHKYFTDAAAGDRLLVAPGKDGVESETYLKYYENGKFIKRVKIRTDKYKSTPQITAIAP